IRKVANKQVTTVLGTGAMGLSALQTQDSVRFNQATDIALNNPFGVTVGPTGLYLADTGNSAIYQVDFEKKVVNLFAGQPGQGGITADGKGRQARFNRPVAINASTNGKFINVLDQG